MDEATRIEMYRQQCEADGVEPDVNSEAYLSLLDYETLVSRAFWASHRARNDRARMVEGIAREQERLDRFLPAARSWWDTCVEAKQQGRKTIRLDKMGIPE